MNQPNDIITLEGSSVDLVPADDSKLEQLENTYDEVIANLTVSADNGAEMIETLSQLAKAGQHHLIFAALASLIKANNETNKEIVLAARAKQELVFARRSPDEKDEAPQSQEYHNHLHVTTTDLVDMIRAKNGVQE